MEVHEILNGKEEVIKFLEEGGFQRERDYLDKDHPDGIYFKIDQKKLLVVYEVFEEEKIKEVKDHFFGDRGLSHCIIVFDGKLIFLRNFGEPKHFIYSKNTQGLSKVSKEDRLKKIGDEGFDFIFQAGKDVSGQFYESFRLKRNLLAINIKNNFLHTEKYLIAQKIFDKFFFIYFLCHKGIIKSNGNNISGKNLFEILFKQKDFLKVLKDLFHKFNFQGEQKRILKFDEYELFVPYLNGGLFRPDVLEQDLDITLKDKQWKEIFEFLNSYHWIIEDVKATEESEDKILTPEILGHVYERSVVEWESGGFEKEAENAIKKITERKKKGVYYTPESITDYISNNTIISYLLDKLGNKYNSFEDLIKLENKKDMRGALKLLDEIKVLDPACGSGAFLIKASEVIFNLKRRLNYALKNKKSFYDLKLDIITENIYGVDILTGAIEISKLRLWLWLISDYDNKSKIEPLPNIEYNLRQGNSLIGFTSFKGKLLEVSKELKEKTKRFEELKSEYKTSHGKTSEIIRELLEKEMKSVRSELNLLYIKDLNSMGIEDFKVKKDIQLNFLGEKIKSKHEKFIYRDEFERELTPFHWVLEFSEVFKDNNPGFDVVIGNPPYFSIDPKLKRISKTEFIIYKTLFHSFMGQTDIFVFFYERFFNILKEGGYLEYISKNRWVNSPMYAKYREFMAGKNIFVIDFDEKFIFQDAGINTNIIRLLKNGYKSITYYLLKTKDTEDIFNFDYYEKFHSVLNDFQKKWDLFSDKITSKLEKLGLEKLEGGCGHKITPSKRFILNKSKEGFYPEDEEILNKYNKKILLNDYEKDFVIPFASSGDICPYYVKNRNRFIVYTKNLDLNKAKNLKDYFSKVIDGKKEEGWYEYHNGFGYRNTNLIELKNKIIAPSRMYLNRGPSFTIVNGKFQIGMDCQALIPKNKYLDLRYTLAILNSSLMWYFYRKKFKRYASRQTVEIEKIPIKDIPEKDQQPFIKLVDEILSITKDKDYPKNKEKQKKVKELQEKINPLVCELYKLTPEEIEIVKNFNKK